MNLHKVILCYLVSCFLLLFYVLLHDARFNFILFCIIPRYICLLLYQLVPKLVPVLGHVTAMNFVLPEASACRDGSR